MGVTLSSFSAVSVDENWKPAFIEGSSKTVHKVSWLIDSSLPLSMPLQLAKLESLAAYFDTDAESMAGLNGSVYPFEFDCPGRDEIVQIAREGEPQDHQFILKPVSGEGRVRQICTTMRGVFNGVIGHPEAKRKEGCTPVRHSTPLSRNRGAPRRSPIQGHDLLV